ncbi:MAG: deoxyribodipyrimidine photo-lyase [SAR202 cluster bacterium]|nr:deoxyribodipyrimidine photo-lyase [SAR202 cluster bacterium]|tara:strand:- start:4320 stop:5744 length:1425 start_codon:yes stop_codon:yes gene_type:complete
MTQPNVIHWFNQDLRLLDNPALFEAAKNNNVLPVYILDNVNKGSNNFIGQASMVWLHHSLESLNENIDDKLSFFKGDPLSILLNLCAKYQINDIFLNQVYEPHIIERDSRIKKEMTLQGISLHRYNASLLWDPDNIKKEDGTPYRVFTPFYRKGCLLNSPGPRKPLPLPENIHFLDKDEDSLKIDDLGLIPNIRWDKKIAQHWNMGEVAAHINLSQFLKTGIKNYKEGRNYPSKPNVSKLSPHMHFGEISPNQIWYKLKQEEPDKNIDHFMSELGWREFSYNQLYFNPDLRTKNLQSKFDRFPWKEDKDKLLAWQRGLTGVPVVDAGMRELWQTGYIHNRVRMIVASFLVKNLLLHWHYGEQWFWDCLVDADLASNSAGWQWVAGSGADAAPYFRIFNPVTQGQKFDPDGVYIRRYVPELAKMPNKYLFNPWEAPDLVLEQAKVSLGVDYPNPIVDIKESRNKALEAFESIKIT